MRMQSRIALATNRRADDQRISAPVGGDGFTSWERVATTRQPHRRCCPSIIVINSHHEWIRLSTNAPTLRAMPLDWRLNEEASSSRNAVNRPDRSHPITARTSQRIDRYRHVLPPVCPKTEYRAKTAGTTAPLMTHRTPSFGAPHGHQQSGAKDALRTVSSMRTIRRANDPRRDHRQVHECGV